MTADHHDRTLASYLWVVRDRLSVRRSGSLWPLIPLLIFGAGLFLGLAGGVLTGSVVSSVLYLAALVVITAIVDFAVFRSGH